MSWGFFADLRVRIATASWTAMLTEKPATIDLPRRWSRLADPSLERSLGTAITKAATFAEVIATYDGPRALHRVAVAGADTAARITLIADGSQLDQIQPLAAIFWIAKREGGSGSLRLVDDGSLGLDGVELALAKGAIKKARVDDWEAVVAELARDLADPAAAAIEIAPTTRATAKAQAKAKPKDAKPDASASSDPALVMPELLAALANAMENDFVGAGGAALRRQPSAVGSYLDEECLKLEEDGDAASIPTLRVQLEAIPKRAKGCRARIAECIAALERRR